jgi:hypothetical protein
MALHVVRSTTAASVVATLAALLLAADALAVSLDWSNSVLLEARRNVYVQDAAFSGGNVGIVWQHDRARTSDIRVRSSANGGATFGPAAVFSDARQGAVAVCGDELDVVFVHGVHAGRSAIRLAVGRVGDDAFTVRTVSGAPGVKSAPDVACTDGRIFVSFYEHSVLGGPNWRWVTTALLADHVFGAPKYLGIDRTNYDGDYAPRGFQIAASGNTAYAVFGTASGELRLKRWTIGPAPGYGLTGHPVEVIAAGTTRCYSEAPVIAAEGATVAVAWTRNSGLVARVSSSRGATWGPRRIVTDVDCGAMVDGYQDATDITVHGSHMAIGVESCGFGYCTTGLYATRDLFAHASWAALWSGPENQFRVDAIGYLTVLGHSRLADAYSNRRSVRFRHSR